MKITESAAEAILQVMIKKGLNPKTTYLEIGVFDGNLGLTFTRDRDGRVDRIGALSVVVATNVDTTGVVVDFGEVNGRKGLIFLGEENVNNHTD
jgi:hypothetical protein